ncbi:MAG: VanZ family protein, partial [Fibromonadales bacterium]|nr:VanZ family protein [Fibromonadales bacterium]
ILRKIPAIIVMAGIFMLSALPGNSPLLNAFEFSDKIKHFIAYFVLGLSLCLWVPSKRWLARPVVWGILVIAICTAFGVCDEFHQSFVPRRSGNDLSDLTADFIGALFSPFIYYLAVRWRASL